MSQNKNERINPRAKRLSEQIYREIRSQIPFFSKDELIKKTSIERVNVSSDLSLATFYVRFIQTGPGYVDNPSLSKEEIQTNLKELNDKNGYFRSLLAKALKIYRVPQVRFIYDDSFEQRQHINQIFEKLNLNQ